MVWHVWHCDEDYGRPAAARFRRGSGLVQRSGPSAAGWRGLQGRCGDGGAAARTRCGCGWSDAGRPDDRTTLMMAAMFNRCDVVDLLVRQCDRADARDPSGMTGLDVACIMDAPDTPRQLAATGRQFSFGLVYCLSNQALGRNSRRISTSSLRIASRSTCGSGGTTGSSSIAPCSARRLPSLLRAPLMVKPCS
jgi:hypothetical protein